MGDEVESLELGCNPVDGAEGENKENADEWEYENHLSEVNVPTEDFMVSLPFAKNTYDQNERNHMKAKKNELLT